MSRIEAVVRIVLAFYEACNRHDLAAMMQLLSDDCRLETSSPAPDGTLYAGKEAITQFWQTFFRDSPQAHIELEDIFGLGFRCVARWRHEWIDAAGQKKHIRGVTIYKVKNNLICEKYSYIKG